VNRVQARQGTSDFRASQRSVRRRPSQSAVPARWPAPLRYVLVFLLLVVIGRVHEAVPGLGSLPVATPAVVLTAIGLVWFGFTRRIPTIMRAPQLRLVLLLLMVGLISVPFSLWPGGALAGVQTFARLCVVCCLLTLAVVNTEQLGTLTRVFAVAAAILVTGQILQSFGGMAGFTRQQSLSFDRNEVAMYCVMAIPFALGWAMSGKRLIGFGLAAYLAVGVVATNSRGGFLALAVLGVVFLVRSPMLSRMKKLVLVAGAVGLAGVAGSEEYWDRIGSIARPADDYNFQDREGRVEIWKRGLGYAAANPITGVGFGNFPIAEGGTLEDEGYGVKWSTAHSSYVLVAAELGIPGLLVFVALVLSIWREARRAARLTQRGRGPPEAIDSRRLALLGEATSLSLVAYLLASVFLSAAYSAGFLFLVSVGASVGILRRRATKGRLTVTRSRVPASA